MFWLMLILFSETVPVSDKPSNSRLGSIISFSSETLGGRVGRTNCRWLVPGIKP